MGIKQRAEDNLLGIEILNILNAKGNTVVGKKEVVVFNINDKQSYEESFLNLVKEGIITGDYSSNTWKGMGNKYLRTLEFSEFEYNRSIYEALKAFVVTQLYHKRISLDTVTSRLNCIKTSIALTQNFNIDYILELDNFLESLAEVTAKEYIMATVYYLLFNPGDAVKEYLEMLSSREEWDVTINPRELPNAESIIIFSNIIEEYMQTASPENKVKYYPIYLWWRITSVIPMRPTEFLKIKRDCLTPTKNGGFRMHITRAKKKPNPFSKKINIPFCDSFDITHEINDLITDYIELAGIENEEYLLPLSVYSRYSKYPSMVEEKSTLKNRFNYRHLGNLLNRFYNEIVKEQYTVVRSQEEITEDNQQAIVKLKLGDTRHLAFCSLMIQGFNPLTIASLGGHRNLDSQMNYHQHLDSYMECHTYLLKKLIKNNVTATGFDGNIKTSREVALLGYNDEKAVRKIKFGWCCSTNFPEECSSVRCVRCSHFKLDADSLNEAVGRELNIAALEIEEEVKSKLGFIKRYYSGKLEELVSGENNKEMKKDAVALRKSIEEQARISVMKERLNEV
jgi:hypothetical protein